MEAHPDSVLARLAGRVRGVVFDFDGTLARLEIDFDFMRAQVLDLAESFGVDVAPYRGGLALETMAAIEAILAADGPGRAEDFRFKAHQAVEAIEIAAADRGGLFPYARPALSALNRAGYRLAVITRNFSGAVARVFPDLADFCPVFIPREKTARVKPDPAHLLAAAAGLGLAPDQVLMVGDHPTDVETGRRAGSPTAGVASGRWSREGLIAAGADLVFDDVADLARRLLDGLPLNLAD